MRNSTFYSPLYPALNPIPEGEILPYLFILIYEAATAATFFPASFLWER